MAARIDDADRVYAPRILKMMASVEEAEVARLMPGSTDEVSTALNRPAEAVATTIRTLLRNGLLIRTDSGEIKFVPTMIHIQDFGTANPKWDTERGEEFLDVFSAMRTSPTYLEGLYSVSKSLLAGVPSCRVIPRWRAIQGAFRVSCRAKTCSRS